MVPRFRSRNFGGMLPVGDAYVKHPVGVGGRLRLRDETRPTRKSFGVGGGVVCLVGAPQKPSINNSSEPITGSLSQVLSRLAVEVRVDGEGETHTEHVREGDLT